MTQTMYHPAVTQGRREPGRRPSSPLSRYLAHGFHGLRLAANRLADLWYDPITDRFNQERARDQQMLRRHGVHYSHSLRDHSSR
jgi:hypothetical protein